VGEVTAPRRNGKAAEPKRPSSRAEAIAALRAAGVSADVAELYADAWVEWREAVDNIAANGSIVAHPRSGAPIENPYLKVRDRAFDRLERMRRWRVPVAVLW